MFTTACAPRVEDLVFSSNNRDSYFFFLNESKSLETKQPRTVYDVRNNQTNASSARSEHLESGCMPFSFHHLNSSKIFQQNTYFVAFCGLAYKEKHPFSFNGYLMWVLTPWCKYDKLQFPPLQTCCVSFSPATTQEFSLLPCVCWSADHTGVQIMVEPPRRRFSSRNHVSLPC